MKKLKTIALVVYVLIGVITFGRAWNGIAADLDLTPDAAVVFAPVCAALWPLYWSQVLWSK